MKYNFKKKKKKKQNEKNCHGGRKFNLCQTQTTLGINEARKRTVVHR
jgi:hypothetical protein